MDVIDVALGATVVLFMVSSLFSVGLAVTPRAALAPLTHRRFVMLTVVVGWIACPVVAWLLVQAVPLAPPYSAALMMLSLAPAAPFAPAMMQAADGDPAYTAGFMVLVSGMTVVIMPIAVPLLLPGAAPDPLVIARPLVAFVLLPLAMGLAVRHVHGELANRIARPAAAINTVAGAALMVFIVVRHGGDVLHAFGSYAIAAQIVFVGLVTMLAHLAGRGFPAEQRNVLTLGMCSRNLGAALAPLAAVERDPRAIVMIAIAVPVTLVFSFATARWLGQSRRHRDGHAELT